MKDLKENLFELRDADYRDFHAKLMPTVEKERIIGIRTPVLRSFAKKYFKTADSCIFLDSLPHYYYEENNLHAMCIGFTSDFETQLDLIEKFLPYVDNWATCDTLAPKSFKAHPEAVLEKVREWIKSEHVYTVRFALVVLMQFFLDDNYTPEILELAISAKNTDYYIMMAKAWFMSFALIKQYDKALPCLTERRLDRLTHNKSIQKALESYRIDENTKKFLRTLKY